MSPWGPDRRPVVGVLPAAGKATRLGDLGGSKELLSVLPPLEPGGQPRPICHGVLRALTRAGAERAVVVIREEKRDIPAALGGGEDVGIPLSYVALADSPSPAFSIDAARDLVGDATVALGFPDVILGVEDPFSPLLARLEDAGEDLVLGLFPPAPGHATDRVDVEPDGTVRAVDLGAGPDDPRPTWTLAVWGSRFSEFLHDLVEEAAAQLRASPHEEGSEEAAVPEREELVLGRVVRRALERGLRVGGVQVATAPFLDVGNPERLREARRRLGSGGDAAPQVAAPHPR